LVLNIVTLVLSVISLLTSAYLLWRQTGTMRNTNAIPIVVELTQAFISPEFQRAEHYVVSELANEHSPKLGCSKLPEDARNAVQTVISLFISFGSFVALGIADEKHVVSLFGYRADRAWKALEPYIKTERELRGEDHPFARFFEDLVWRTRKNSPWTEAYNLNLGQVSEESQPEKPEG
jgi:hypothetical protein